MNEELQEKINKLPKWAQRLIARLERDVASYKAQLSQTKGDSPIRWDLYTKDGAGGGIPTHARILIDTHGGTLECTLRDGSLYIRGYNLERPVVRPDCAGIRVNAEK